MTAHLSHILLPSDESLTVTITLSSAGGVPTGTVMLSGGGYTSKATALSSGAATIVIPANTLKPGAVTLTVTYAQTADYTSVSVQKNLTVRN